MTQVALLRGSRTYPNHPPFHPPALFPEMVGAGIRQVDASNQVYGAVRDTLALLGLDRSNFGTSKWNPLGTYIRPGDKVVIKPNLVLHQFGPQRGADCLTTHGSVLRAVLDYVYLAAGPQGVIVIADAPLQGADFHRVCSDAGLGQIQDFYRQSLHTDVAVLDLRQVHAVIDEESSLIRRVERLAGDPRGYCEIDLAETSRLNELGQGDSHYVVGDYDAAVTNSRHRGPHHSYVVSRTVLEADAIVCVPKLKTHSKTGVTVCLKNMVGIVGSKDCLPHHRHGKTSQGGDEFPEQYPYRWLLSTRIHGLLQGRVPTVPWRLMRGFAETFLKAGTPANGKENHGNFFHSGGWHGNDTIWRTVDDLNRILFFYDPATGTLQQQPRRRYFALVDAIVAMEGNGPLRGVPKPVGLIMAGDDPLAVDVVAATLMGFDWRRIRMLQGIAGSTHPCRYSAIQGDESAIELLSDVQAWSSFEALARDHLNLRPPNGWRQFVEMQHVG